MRTYRPIHFFLFIDVEEWVKSTRLNTVENGANYAGVTPLLTPKLVPATALFHRLKGFRPNRFISQAEREWWCSLAIGILLLAN